MMPGAEFSAAASNFAGNRQLLDRIRLWFLRLRRLERRRFLDRNRELVLARQLRLTRRGFHLVSAATTAAAWAGLGEPHDVRVHLFREKGGRRRGSVTAQRG